MPTGYTAGVQDGTITDFRTFALQCARAFGATIMQRDDPMNVPPAERKVDAYYRTALAESKARVSALSAMTDAEAEASAEKAYQAAMESYRERRQRNEVEQGRYRAMLSQAEAWEPPTPDHSNLKEFMLTQLREAKEWDDVPPTLPERKTGRQWLAEELVQAARMLEIREKSLREEEERCAQASLWVRRLYESLELARV